MFRKLFVVAFGTVAAIGGGHETQAAQRITALPAISAGALAAASTAAPTIARVRFGLSRGLVLSGFRSGHVRGHGSTRLRFHGLGSGRFRSGFHRGRPVFHRGRFRHRFSRGPGAYYRIRHYYPPGHWGYHGAYYQGYPDTGGHAVYLPGRGYGARHDNLYRKHYDN